SYFVIFVFVSFYCFFFFQPKTSYEFRVSFVGSEMYISDSAFFCSKVTGAPPFHDVNVTQLIVIDYYYHAVVMLSCISTLTKVQKKGKLADEQKILF
ncbi:hypothetical protein AWZ92_25080, partial [Shigella sonnei]